MARTPHVAETGAIGIQNNDINTCNDGRLTLWVNDETGRSPLASAGQSGITVGDEVASVMTGQASEASGGFVLEDGGQTKAIMARRESKRAPRGFDDPNMDAETFDMATEERIRAEAQADKESTEIAFKHRLIELVSQAQGVDIPSRAEKCRQDVMNRERFSRTVGNGWFNAHTEPVAPDTQGPQVSKHTPITTTEVERTPVDRDHVAALKRSTVGELTQAQRRSTVAREEFVESTEQIGEANATARRLAARFEKPTLTADYFARCMARRLLNGEDPYTAMFNLKDEVETITDVVQPLNAIDPYSQQTTTVVVTVDKLFHPKGDGQRQVGYVSDDSGTQVKLTIWFNAGHKRTLKEGDTVKLTDTKVNAYNGDPTLAVVADTKITHREHGDGEGTRAKKRKDMATIAAERKANENDITGGNCLPAWDADSDTHNWHNGLAGQGDGESDKTDLETELLNLWVTKKITQEQYDHFLNSSDELTEEDKTHVCNMLVEYRK